MDEDVAAAEEVGGSGAMMGLVSLVALPLLLILSDDVDDEERPPW